MKSVLKAKQKLVARMADTYQRVKPISIEIVPIKNGILAKAA